MMATASATCSQAVAPKNTPWVHDTPACSPIMAKWMPAAPRSSAAMDHRRTSPIEVARDGRRSASRW